MKRRYVPVYSTCRKESIISSVAGILLSIAVFVGLFIEDRELAVILPIPFVFIYLITLFPLFDDARITSYKYEIKDASIISYAPLKKPRTIELSKVADIYIVMHYADIIAGRTRSAPIPVKDVNDKSKIVYDVILLKEGIPPRFAPKINNSSTITKKPWFGFNASEFVLFDFNYDPDSVLQLLKKTNATVYTTQEMYTLLTKDKTFREFSDRIQQKEFLPG